MHSRWPLGEIASNAGDRVADEPAMSGIERARDTEELKNVEAELQGRQDAQRKAAQAAHGGAKVCRRVADLPNDKQEAGMGETDGSVPGRGGRAEADAGAP